MSLPRRIGQYDVVAGLAVVVGALLLAENFGLIGHVGEGWPLTVTLAGAALIVAGAGRGRYGRGLIGAGVYLVQTSFLFLYLNLTTWSRMADLWPLFIGFLGVAIFVSGEGRRRTGTLLWVSLFLMFLTIIFFLVFNVEAGLWPVSLILFGISLFFLGRERREEASRDH